MLYEVITQVALQKIHSLHLVGHHCLVPAISLYFSGILVHQIHHCIGGPVFPGVVVQFRKTEPGRDEQRVERQCLAIQRRRASRVAGKEMVLPGMPDKSYNFV